MPNDRPALEAAVDAYLSSQHTILYADWDLTRNKDKAVQWLTTQILNVAEHFTPNTPFADYAGPYTTEAGGGGLPPQPTALRRTDGPV